MNFMGVAKLATKCMNYIGGCMIGGAIGSIVMPMASGGKFSVLKKACVFVTSFAIGEIISDAAGDKIEEIFDSIPKIVVKKVEESSNE